MRCLCIAIIALAQFGFPNTSAYADTPTLIGKVEHEHLANDVSLNTQASTNFPKQPDYAQAISNLLKGYSINSLFNVGAQNSNLQSVAQQNSNVVTKKGAVNLQDILANHDLSIIVDRSGSMATADCPGGLSRWEWCSEEASQLAQAAAKASSSVTIMFFNSDLQIFDSVRPESIPALFKMYNPMGGTILGAPLVAQLDRYFSKRSKPLIIVVITDGIPQDNDLPIIIRDASDSLHYVGEVTISFLLVGKQVNADQFGHLIGELDGGGIQNGGMVDVIGFNQMANKGIRQILFNELKTIILATNKSIPSQADKFSTGRNLSFSTAKTSTGITVFQSSNVLNPFPFTR